jgi:hypothetical protein
LLKTTQNAQTDIKWLSAHPTVLARIQRWWKHAHVSTWSPNPLSMWEYVSTNYKVYACILHASHAHQRHSAHHGRPDELLVTVRCPHPRHIPRRLEEHRCHAVEDTLPPLDPRGVWRQTRHNTHINKRTTYNVATLCLCSINLHSLSMLIHHYGSYLVSTQSFSKYESNWARKSTGYKERGPNS